MHTFRVIKKTACGVLRTISSNAGNYKIQRRCISVRTVVLEKPKAIENDTQTKYPRKIFSGIQPTGGLHLGNYLGAIRKWTELQNGNEDVTFCIVDMHSITLPQDPYTLRDNIFKMAATLLACGIDSHRSTVFVQSAVQEHSELCWILNCLSTMARLAHLPQYKEKTRTLRDIPLGLYVYPVLQAADIMLYKTTHVPVGEDQVQHIQLAQHLARVFNGKFGETFPVCHAIVDNKEAARIRSLRDPTKKMSKSDPDPKSTIYITDEPDVIVEKIKKAVTDFTSDVNFNPAVRLGVSNLIAIHALLTNKSIENIVDEARTIDTGKYKMRVAEAVVEHLTPIRMRINQHLVRRSELTHILDSGAEKARDIAYTTMKEVRQRIGLGALSHMPAIADLKSENEDDATANASKTSDETMTEKSANEKPAVPQQMLRVEKRIKPVVVMNASNTTTHGMPAAPESSTSSSQLMPVPTPSSPASTASEEKSNKTDADATATTTDADGTEQQPKEVKL